MVFVLNSWMNNFIKSPRFYPQTFRFDSCPPESKKRNKQQSFARTNKKASRRRAEQRRIPTDARLLGHTQSKPGFVVLFRRQTFLLQPFGFVSLLFINTATLCSSFHQLSRYIQTSGLDNGIKRRRSRESEFRRDYGACVAELQESTSWAATS